MYYKADFSSISLMLEEVVMSWSAGLPNSLKQRNVTAITPFKVTDFSTSRKLLYDFLLVISTEYLLSCTVSKLWLIIRQTFASFNALTGGDPLSISP